MDPRLVSELARELLAGTLELDDFVLRLRSGHTAELGQAAVDLDRQRRCGYPEVVFAQGKTIPALLEIVGALAGRGIDVLATRVDAEQARALTEQFAQGRYNAIGRVFRLPPLDKLPAPAGGHVVIISAGTSDMPVAEEARETAAWMGCRVSLIQDVGVAGPHRLPRHLPTLEAADAIVVLAGMEGALPSVVGGFVSCPVIGVPTSVGYGASFGGLAALLAMLNSCASNVAVVNIDAGFKGAYLAGMIANRSRRDGTP